MNLSELNSPVGTPAIEPHTLLPTLAAYVKMKPRDSGSGVGTGKTGEPRKSLSRSLLGGSLLLVVCIMKHRFEELLAGPPRLLKPSSGYGSKLHHQGTTGFSHCVHLPGFHFGVTLFLTHSQVNLDFCLACLQALGGDFFQLNSPQANSGIQFNSDSAAHSASMFVPVVS